MEVTPECEKNNHREDSSVQGVAYEYLTYSSTLESPCPVRITGETGSLPGRPDLHKYDDPFKWPNSRKRALIWISSVGTALTAYTAGCYAPAVDQMTEEFHISYVAMLVGISIFTAGFGVAPMVLAPFSEINGRRPVFIISGIIYVICVACCAATQDYAGMLIARFIAGCGSSTFSTMVGGVVADIYEKQDRNTPMTVFTCGAIFGTGLGPLLGGFIAQNVSWRWVFGSHAIALAVLMTVIILCFWETRSSILLSRKAAKLNQWYDACEQAGSPGLVPLDDPQKPPRRVRWKVQADEERQSLLLMIRISFFRPFHLLTTEPVVFFFSLWISFCWLVLYLTFAALPYIFTTVYAFSLQQSGAVFASLCVAAIIASFLSIYQERTALQLGKLSASPESRLFFTCIESAFLPIGLFWLGWTAFPSIHWIVPTLAVGAATIGIFSIYLATFNYLADCYGAYASSAIAGQSLCRNLIGGAAPLYTDAMFRRIGIGPACSLLGGLGALLTIVPWVLAFKGKEIRSRSRFAVG